MGSFIIKPYNIQTSHFTFFLCELCFKSFLTIDFSEAMPMQDLMFVYWFSPTWGFHRNKLWHFYVVAFSYFFHWVLGVLHNHIVYKYSYFSTRFFKDNIHSKRRSSTREGVFQHKWVWPLDRTGNCCCWPPTWCPLKLNYCIPSLRASSRGHLARIKGRSKNE
jgi:hypothetical protein